MNCEELKKTLEELGIPEGAVSLTGEARPACISLKALRNNVWQVFFIVIAIFYHYTIILTIIVKNTIFLSVLNLANTLHVL